MVDHLEQRVYRILGDDGQTQPGDGVPRKRRQRKELGGRHNVVQTGQEVRQRPTVYLPHDGHQRRHQQVRVHLDHAHHGGGVPQYRHLGLHECCHVFVAIDGDQHVGR